MAEFIVIGSLVGFLLALGVLTWIFQVVARLLAIPFGVFHWLLHGLGFLITLPFVLAFMILKVGFTMATWLAGGFVLLLAAVSFAGALFALARGLWGRPRHGVTA